MDRAFRDLQLARQLGGGHPTARLQQEEERDKA
jgi:hypothetical protein